MLRSALVGVAALVPAIAEAQVAYSNFLPNQVFTSGVHYGSAFLGEDPEIGFRFTSSLSGGISQIRTGLWRISTPVNPVLLSLYADTPAGPGALLGSWSVTPPTSGFSNMPPVVFTLDGTTQLSAGESYVLTVASLPGSPNWQWWAAGTQQSPVMGDQFFRNGSGAWELDTQPMTAFEITVVPAPGVGLMGVRRRR
jgi:hypothetical protein